MVEDVNVGKSEELRDLVRMEIADIIATAKEAGFNGHETLEALAAAIEESLGALEADAEKVVEVPPHR